VAFWDWLSFNKKRIDYDIRQIVNASARASIRPVNTGGRQTYDKWEQPFNWYDMSVIPRDSYKSKDVMESLKIIRDLSPDASMAIWNFLRLANSGHEVEVYTKNGKVDKKATELLNEKAKQVGKLYGGGTDQLINVLLLTSFTQGAIALEVEIQEGLKDIEDIHAVDPSTLDFKKNKETGVIELVQKQIDGTFKVLNPETVFFYPFDPEISDPHGRSPILPVLQIVFFQIEILKDLRKVVHHQGHRRFDIKVLEESIVENMPDDIKYQGPEAVRSYVQDYIQQIQDQMNDLEPDADFFHTDSVEIGMAGGNSSSGNLDISRVIDVINQQIVTGLKQLPILLGRNEGTTETHGTIQWQIYVKGIESIQRGIKRLLERAYNVVLQINGIQGSAVLTFDEIQVTDRKSDAEAEQIETNTKILQYQQGWIDNNEAAMEMVNHKAVSEPISQSSPAYEPAPTDSGEDSGTDEGKDTQEDDQTSRSLKKKDYFSLRVKKDEFVSELNVSWANDLAKLTTQTRNAYSRFLNDQRDKYIKRLENAGKLPTTVLTDMRSLKSFCREDETPSPPHSFQSWVMANIIFDSEQQIDQVRDLSREWMMEAAIMSGSATLEDLDVDMYFNERDTRLLRWVQERSLREAQLIQGVTDEYVLQTLWDVVYDGDLTIKTAADELSRVYAFSPSRATTIARTEIISASRSGQYFGDQQSGIVIGKRWRSALQERTRAGHRGANGQVVAFDEPFVVANGSGQMEYLMFPSDSSLGASASNCINCRCWYERILEGEEM